MGKLKSETQSLSRRNLLATLGAGAGNFLLTRRVLGNALADAPERRLSLKEPTRRSHWRQVDLCHT